MAAWNSFSYICTRAIHSFLSFAHCRAASAVILLLPKDTFTPSIQPNLGLPGTRPPLTSAINTLLAAIQYSSILSTCPNYLNTLWSALLANSLSIPALLRTSSFLTLSIRDTPRNFSNTSSQEHSLSFSQQFSYAVPLLHTTPLVQLFLHIESFWLLSPILYCSEHFQRSLSSIPLIHSACHIPFTPSISCNLRP